MVSVWGWLILNYVFNVSQIMIVLIKYAICRINNVLIV